MDPPSSGSYFYIQSLIFNFSQLGSSEVKLIKRVHFVLISSCSETKRFHFQLVFWVLFFLACFRGIITRMGRHENGSNLFLDRKNNSLLVTDGPTAPLWQSCPQTHRNTNHSAFFFSGGGGAWCLFSFCKSCLKLRDIIFFLSVFTRRTGDSTYRDLI